MLTGALGYWAEGKRGVVGGEPNCFPKLSTEDMTGDCGSWRQKRSVVAAEIAMQPQCIEDIDPKDNQGIYRGRTVLFAPAPWKKRREGTKQYTTTNIPSSVHTAGLLISKDKRDNNWILLPLLALYPIAEPSLYLITFSFSAIGV